MTAVWTTAALTGFLQPLQQQLTDWSAKAVAAPAAPEVVLVAIDDASLAALGPWPWPRELHARLIDRLSETDVAAVAYAVAWNGPEPREALNQLSRLAETVAADPLLAGHEELTGWMQQSQVLLDGDARLVQSLLQNRRTVLAIGPAGSADGGLPLASLVSGAAGIGHVHLPVEHDGSTRHLALLEQRGDRWVPALPLAAVALWHGQPVTQLRWERSTDGSRAAALGRLRWTVDASGRIEPLWAAHPGPAWVRHWPAAELMAGRLPPGGLRGRLAVVGLQTADPAAGWHPLGDGAMTTAEAVAQTSAALIHDHLLSHPAWGRLVAAALVAVLTLYLMLVLPMLGSASALAMSGLWVALMLAGAHLAVVVARTDVPVALPIATLLAGHLATAWTRRGARPARARSRVAAASRTAVADTDRPTATQPAPPPAAPPLTTTRPLQGPMIDDYRLQQEIGRGAMGRVYRAVQASTGRLVAVKTLALTREFDGFALQDAQQRFQREALAASRLQHPDIVRILDTGDHGGLVWIAMELLDGHDLVRHTSDGQLLPVPTVLELCARIAAALAHAHAHGVVHRDVKPANVMVALDAARVGLASVKVTDFGIARITDAARTRTGLVLGSPSYMSPEHLAGRAVDGRSDLYSLGVLLFQLLTGQLPFQGSTVAELMHAVAHVPAPDVRQLRPRLPEAVSNIVTLALEKRPELRYADGLQLAADLRAVAALWQLPANRTSTTV